MAKGKGLGRGLEAIFAEEVPAQNVPTGIRLSDIEPNPRQPRRDFDPAALEELAQSIRENGVITPITLRKTGDTYQIIAVFKTSANIGEGFAYHLFDYAQDKAEFDEYIDTVKSLRFYWTGVEAEYGDMLITLSTCEYTLDNGRLVVVAKRIS